MVDIEETYRPHGYVATRTALPGSIDFDLHHPGDHPLLLSRPGDASSRFLPQSSYSHANQYRYSHADWHAKAADRYAGSTHWHGYYHADTHLDLHSFVDLYAIPDAYQDCDSHCHARPTHFYADVYLDGHEYSIAYRHLGTQSDSIRNRCPKLMIPGVQTRARRA